MSPDDLVRDYGCDSLRMYELFVGPPELDSEWDDRGIDGVNRFLNRFWNLVMDNKDSGVQATKEMVKVRHKMIHEITTRLENFSLNTVISGFMEYTNKMVDMARNGGIPSGSFCTAYRRRAVAPAGRNRFRIPCGMAGSRQGGHGG